MILITRPLIESNLLAQELSKYSIETCIEPLISFSYNKRIFFENKSVNYILSSTQSVYVLEKNFSKFKNILRKGNFFVIGKKVANKLKLIGSINIVEIFENSHQLIKFLNHNDYNNDPFVYLCGNIFNNNLFEELENFGTIIEKKFLYKTIQRKKLTKKTIENIDSQIINSVALYSSHTAETFIQLISDAKLTRQAQNIRFFCLSRQIADVLRKNGFNNVDYCKISNQDEMIRMIRMLRKHKNL